MSRREPVYITLKSLADTMGWPKPRALRWAKREKVVFMLAGRWVTTKDRIAASFPEVLDRISEREE